MFRKHISALALVMLFAATAPAQVDKVADLVKAEMKRQNIPGLSLAVVRDGKVILAAGYGVANRESRDPTTPETIYKICSVSKQFIATAIMLLAQEGRLGLDDPISKYLEGTPESWKAITVRHLLTHTSGIVREGPGFDPFKVQSDAAVVRSAYPVPLRFNPGEKWAYCNTGYFALAEIIRKVSGRPWSQYLSEKVFNPSGMNATFTTDTKERLPNRATGYSDNDKLRKADDWPALRPSGAFLSTVLDLAKWDAMLYTDKILSDSSRRQMWAPVKLNNGASHPYGFGWQLGEFKGRKLVHHSGGMPGFRTKFARFVDDRLTIIVLMNLDDADVDAIVFGIAALYLPAPAPSQVTGGSAAPLVIGETFTIESRALGETRRINVYLPPGYSKQADSRFPVFYMPDGGIEEDFLHVAGLVQISVTNGTMRPFLLVGIENTERRRDMTGPTENEEDKKIAPKVGGSAAFRKFIRDELMPEVKRRYRTTSETAIVGESLAGLFVVETFLTEPDMFDAYIAIDPSLWWNDEALVKSAADRLRARPGLSKTLYLASSNEKGIATVTRRFAEILKLSAPPALRWRHERMPGEEHSTIYHPAALKAFRSVFKPSPARAPGAASR